MNKVQTEPIAPGTQWIGKGAVMDDNGSYNNPDYFYYIHCTVLDGRIDSTMNFDQRLLENEKLTCNIDICVGVDHSEVGVADCVFLKGLTKFDIMIKTSTAENLEGDFYASVIGGLGRFTGSIGRAEFIPGGNPGVGAIVDLDATVSPYYEGEKVEVPLPPRLDTSTVP